MSTGHHGARDGAGHWAPRGGWGGAPPCLVPRRHSWRAVSARHQAGRWGHGDEQDALSTVPVPPCQPPCGPRTLHRGACEDSTTQTRDGLGVQGPQRRGFLSPSHIRLPVQQGALHKMSLWALTGDELMPPHRALSSPLRPAQRHPSLMPTEAAGAGTAPGTHWHCPADQLARRHRARGL